MTTYRKNIEQVLFDVQWLNVPHSLKIPSSFGNDSTVQRLTEWNIPRRMPHKNEINLNQQVGGLSATSTIKQRETEHIIVRTSERDHTVLLGL